VKTVGTHQTTKTSTDKQTEILLLKPEREPSTQLTRKSADAAEGQKIARGTSAAEIPTGDRMKDREDNRVAGRMEKAAVTDAQRDKRDEGRGRSTAVVHSQQLRHHLRQRQQQRQRREQRNEFDVAGAIDRERAKYGAAFQPRLEQFVTRLRRDQVTTAAFEEHG